jgi:5'-nucleotidase / UDP-sugar diphosphatase
MLDSGYGGCRMLSRTLPTRIALFLVALALVVSATAATGGAEATTRIVILHDNDLHFTLNHTSRVREVVEGVRARHANVFLLSAGDLFVRYPRQWRGGLEYYRRKSEAVIGTMNELGYDAATLGNHDLYPHGAVTGRSLRLAAFPLLGANIDIGGADLPAPRPYVTLRTKDGVSVAVIGLSVVNFRHRQVRARDPQKTFASYAHLRRDHDVVVALTHLGVWKQIELARAFPEIDVVIGGHTHTLLPSGTRAGTALVAQTGGHSHAADDRRPMQLGEVVLVLEDRRIVETCAFVYAIDATGPKPLAPSAANRPIGAGTCGTS